MKTGLRIGLRVGLTTAITLFELLTHDLITISECARSGVPNIFNIWADDS